MNHKDLQDKLLAFHDAELPEAERQAVKAHLPECGECRKILKRWETVRCSLAGSVPVYEDADAFTAKVMGRIEALERAAEPQVQPSWKLPDWLFPALGYSFAFILMFLAIENRELPANTEAVLLADVPQRVQLTLAAEAADAGKLVELP